MVWNHEDFTEWAVIQSHGYVLETEGRLKKKDLAVNISCGSCVREYKGRLTLLMMESFDNFYLSFGAFLDLHISNPSPPPKKGRMLRTRML